MVQETRERPWTVYALVGLFVVGSVVGFVLDNDRNLWDVVTLLFSAGIIYLLWAGKRWAYILMFVLIALSLVGTSLSAIARVVSADSSVPMSSWWGIANLAMIFALLMHPATKRFAGIERGHSRSESAPS